MGETVGIIGLGMIAKLHIQALEQIEDVEVIGGTDVDTRRTLSYMGRRLPVYASIDDLLDRSPSAVIVATPTPTHHEIYRRLASHGKRPPRVMIEKPLGSSPEQVDDILASGDGMDVIGVYHAAHAPEVLWAMENALAWQEAYGAWSGYVASFADPYRDRGRAHNQVYLNSWLDSGINALSAAYRFLDLTAVDRLTILDDRSSIFEAPVRFLSNGMERAGMIRTSWDVSAPEKHSTLRLGEETHLYLNHQRVSGSLQHRDRVLAEFEYTGTVPRLQLHYQNAFRSLFVNNSGYYTAGDSRVLHGLLFERTPEHSGEGAAR